MTVIAVLSILGLAIGTGVDYGINVKPEYNKAAGGYFEAAYWSDTPELMKKNLVQGRQGLVDLGLTPSMYGEYFSWDHTPDVKMSHQFDEIDALIERVDDVIKWRVQQDKSGDRDQMNDVYQAKLTSLREYMREDCGIDCVAVSAFVINKHPFHAYMFSLGWTIYTVLVLVALISGIRAAIVFERY